MNVNVYRQFDKFCLLLRSYLRIAAIFVLSLGTLAPLFSKSAEAQTVYYLQNDQSPVGTSQTWKTAADWSGGIAPGSTNGAIFTVGDDYWLRAPGDANTSTPHIFPYKNGGDYNWLYLGYNHDATAYDTGYLNIKCPTVVINKLVLGNGTVYNGNDDLALTIQGTMDVRGDAYLHINNKTKSDGKADSRNFTIESAITGTGTLNLTANKKTHSATDYMFKLESASNTFTGSVVIDKYSRVAFNAVDVFKSASSVPALAI